MSKPNPLKKLLVDDEKEFYLYLKEWEIEALVYSLHIYKSLLQQKGSKEKEIKLIEDMEVKIDISRGYNL